jgi:hypothetical protein
MWLKSKTKFFAGFMLALLGAPTSLQSQTSPETKIGLGVSLVNNVHSLKFRADDNNVLRAEESWMDLNGLMVGASFTKKAFTADLNFNIKEALLRVSGNIKLAKNLKLSLGAGIWNYGHGWLNEASIINERNGKHFGTTQWGYSYSETYSTSSFFSVQLKYNLMPNLLIEASYQQFLSLPKYERMGYYFADNWQDPGKNIYTISHPVMIGVKWELNLESGPEKENVIHINKGDDRTKIIYQ